jgi:repressor LexA
MSLAAGTKRTRVGDPLTRKQAAVLEAIRQHQARHGIPPTVRQLSELFGFAYHTGVMSHLNALVVKGVLRHLQAGSARCYIPIVPDNCCPACGQKLVESQSQSIDGGSYD